MRVIGIAVAGLAFVTVAAEAAAGAQAGNRLPPSTVLTAPGARPVNPPALDLDARGRAVVAWTQEGRSGGFELVVRRRTASGRLGQRQLVSRWAYDVSVAAGRSGGGAILFKDGRASGGLRRLKVAVARGTRRFGRPRTLVSVRAVVTGERVFALPGGRYLAIWYQGDPRTGRHPVRYAVSSTSGRFGRPRTLVSDTGPMTSVSAAQGPDGSILAAWGTPLGGTPQTNQQLAAAVLAPGARRFGPHMRVRAHHADEGAETTGIQAVGGPGGLALAWLEHGSLPALLRASMGPFSATTPVTPAPETIHTVDSDDLGKRWAHGPALALPAIGTPVAAWALMEGPGGESSATTAGRVVVAERRSDGTYGPQRRLSDSGTIATQPKAAASASHALVAWTTGSFPRFRPWFSVRRAGDDFATPKPMSARPLERAPVLAASRAGILAAFTTRGRRSRSARPSQRPVVALVVLAES